MKIYHIKDIDGFFNVVDSCQGKIELVTGEGDKINLKSKLCQYISLAEIFSNGELPEMELIVQEPADMKKLIDYLV